MELHINGGLHNVNDACWGPNQVLDGVCTGSVCVKTVGWSQGAEALDYPWQMGRQAQLTLRGGAIKSERESKQAWEMAIF